MKRLQKFPVRRRRTQFDESLIPSKYQTPKSSKTLYNVNSMSTQDCNSSERLEHQGRSPNKIIKVKLDLNQKISYFTEQIDVSNSFSDLFDTPPKLQNPNVSWGKQLKKEDLRRPKKVTLEILSDRYIPNRKAQNIKGNMCFAQYKDIENIDMNQRAINLSKESCITIPKLYRAYILGIKPAIPDSPITYSCQNMLKYKLRLREKLRPNDGGGQSTWPMCPKEESLLHFARNQRKIDPSPYKVLDAPALNDDFYLNLLDWGKSDMLSVGLSQCVYLWQSSTSKVEKLCDLINETVTSVNWNPDGTLLAVGTEEGKVQIWDPEKMMRVRILTGHNERVGTIAWGNTILASGSRDKNIIFRDMRCADDICFQRKYHKQEICGLKWSPNYQQLASGGNDNKLLIWNLHSQAPVIEFKKHRAAVKAISWSPHQHGLIASGGGTADRNVRFWNTLTARQIDSIDTGSQVCNLLFSKNVNELVSTHGYSQNQINIWKYPSMQKVTVLTGHTMRVLYLSGSPDGSTIVTGAGDETLRFWKIFPGKKQSKKGPQSPLHENFLGINDSIIR